MRRREISAEEYERIEAAEKAIQDKKISRKLRILMLRYNGYDNKAIAERLGISSTRVTHLVGEYFKTGLEEYSRMKHDGNHRNMSEEEENEILTSFEKKAKSGQVMSYRLSP